MTESEWKTRKQRIDPRLDEAGWRLPRSGTTPLHVAHRVEELPTDNGPADYALVVDNGVVAIVEAKKVGAGPQSVLSQAERYSRGYQQGAFNFDGYRVPFVYSTNGEQIWFRDLRDSRNLSRKIAEFHTPDALRELLVRDFDAACDKLAATPNQHPRLRPYQTEANTAVEQAIADRKRHLLVAMATGTGKTFTMVNQAYRLMKSGAAKRVLFLVDRRALAAQAVRAFASFEAEPGVKFDKAYEVYSNKFQKEDFDEDDKFDSKVLPREYLTQPQAKHVFVYVCTIQRMAINVLGHNAIFGLGDEKPDDDVEPIKIPIHAFDAVIADECHRGYSSAEISVWRNTLDHFDAVKIGLTATPAAHTIAYFGRPAFKYDYRQAVQDGYLVDYDAVKISSKIRLEGVFLKEGENVEVVDTETGQTKMDELEDERSFSSDDIESKVTAPDSNRKIIGEIEKYALEHEKQYGRFPKTLIFAANDLPHVSHADQLVQLAAESFGRGENFVRKITGRVDRPLQRIREFRNRPEPGVAITVDLLSTGVDIPDLEFIVFLRPIQSRILFEQMIGRGTRRGEKFPDKSHFTVFDCFDGTLLKRFAGAAGITADPLDPPTRTIAEVIEAIWNNQDRDYNIRCLVKRLHRVDKQMDAEARTLFSAFVPDGDMAKYARELPAKLKQDFAGQMKLLRDTSFQDLLVNYSRAKRVFIKTYETIDDVTSQWTADGHGLDSYLEAFATFVRDNPAQIDAIAILLDRPRDWTADALTELRNKLLAANYHFNEENLRQAHERRYKKALCDIISMVKHAADERQPLLTAAERVQRAFEKLSAGKKFSAEQQRWLEHIRLHLTVSLSISQQDFDEIPIFSREGGLAAARRAFGDGLGSLLHQLNEAIAA